MPASWIPRTGSGSSTSPSASYYVDRHWRQLLRRAGIEDADRRLEALLGRHDLKRSDAVAALRRVARRLAEDPSLAHRPRRSVAPFVAAEVSRERAHSPLDGLPVEEVRPALAAYLLAGGRHGDLVAGAVDGAGDGGPGSEAERIWDGLDAAGELDAAVFRWRALRAAPERARRAGVTPRSVHRDIAGEEIARALGFDSWSELSEHVDPASGGWARTLAHRDELAWAVCLREVLFSRR